MEFPELKAQAIRLARLYRAKVLLVEDQSSGIALIHELRKYPEAGVPVPIARKTEGDKISRVEGISAMVEAGQLLLPDEAPWLAEFKSELLGFPSARYDDQTDAMAQLLHWVRSRHSTSIGLAAPILFWTDEYDVRHSSGGEAYCLGEDYYDPGLDPW